MKFIKFFKEISMKDIGSVGGKNASLGQMISDLSKKKIKIPDGFAITADAYWHFLESNKLVNPIVSTLKTIKKSSNIKTVAQASKKIRALMENAELPDDIAQEIAHSYQILCKEYKQKEISVAVRSSATAEDLPTASFAGQQESFLNMSGLKDILDACKKCFSSLFTARAIIYRQEKGFDHFKVALSIGIQKMIQAEASGVAFSLDTETGFKDAIIINASCGLGQAIVSGEVTPDEFIVHKPTLQKGFPSIIKKKLGHKEIQVLYAKNKQGIKSVAVAKERQGKFCLSDDEIIALSKEVMIIEQLYSQLKGSWCPMDIEWAKDELDKKLYIIQARPETIYGARAAQSSYTVYSIEEKKLKIIASGQSIGQQIVSGPVKIVSSLKEIDSIQKGDILITRMTDPDWVPAMKKAAGIITQEGGRTCHAAIVSRELNIPAIVGVVNAMKIFKDKQKITLDCSQGVTGYIYEGQIPFKKKEIALANIPQVPVAVMMNLGDPDRAFALSHLPVDGIGLARIEFIITNSIKIHPMALLHPEFIKDAAIKKEIEKITSAYSDKKEFFIDSLAQGISTIAAAFYPKPVIVRFSDFKTNEYRNLIGGSYFEPEEENPMIGFRGAMRYYHARYKYAFALECAAIKKAREIMGFTNIKVMIPFVRTVEEAQKVIAELSHNGLKSKQKGLEIIMMCEIPSNVLLIDEFLHHFDGISIGSNDLTQLTLGVDRDSAFTAGIFDERNEAVKKMFELAVAGAKRHEKYSGICGQAPSDYPEIAQYLMKIGIQSISLNPDTVVPFLMRFK
jgi:pyruvate,water dikinase